MTLEKALVDFIHDKRLAGLSDSSIKSYEQHIGMFIKFVGGDLDHVALSREMIDAYRESLVTREISKGTVSSYARDMKIFIRWLEQNFDLNYDSASIKVPKTPKTTPRIYSIDDMGLVLKSIHNNVEWLEIRNKCMIALMYDSGLRRSEICRLKLEDVNFNSNNMRIYGKGDKERVVPLGSTSRTLMLKYLSLCPFTSNYVFVCINGNKVTPNTLKQLCAKISTKLPFEFSCHRLRHNFATNYCLDLLERKLDFDIYALRSMMGHSDIQTTERYLHIAQEIFASRNHISHLDLIMEKLV